MDEIPEGLEDLLKDILGDEKPKKKSSALAVIPKADKQEEDVVDDDIDERILRLLGLEGVTDIDYATYKSLLREKVASARMSGSKMASDEVELLTKEFSRVKKSTGRFKVKQKKVKAEKIFSTAITKTSRPTKQEDFIPDGLDDLISSVRKEQDQEEIRKENKKDKEETAIQFIRKTISPSLTKIEKNLDSILDTLTKQFQFDKKQSEKTADAAQTARKKAREDKLETDNIKSKEKDVKKVSKPAKGLLDTIMDFFKNILLGGVLVGLLNIIKNPAKALQPFVDALNGVIRFVNGAITAVFDFIVAPINALISSVYNGLSGLESQVNRVLELLGQEPLNNFPAGEAPVIEKPQWLEIPEVENPLTKKEPESEPASGMQGGGYVSSSTGTKVSGMGVDTQLVALQPGEVVMSRPAVNAYGASNLLAMNKAGGGTNIPRMGSVMGMAGGGILDFIGSGEGGYNSMNQGTIGNSIVGSTHNASSKLGKNLTDMSIGEVMDRQSYLMNPANPQVGNYGIFAAGKYQIIPATMPGAVKAAKLSRDDMFSPSNQDKLGTALIMNKRPRVGDYLTGKSNDLYGAVEALSLEFASIPNPATGRSQYGSGNRTAHTVAEVEDALRRSRESIMSGQPISSTSTPTQISPVETSPTKTQTSPVVTSPTKTQPAPSPPTRSGTKVVVAPAPAQQTRQAPSSGSSGSQSKVPFISPIDSGNTELMVIKAIYNIVG